MPPTDRAIFETGNNQAISALEGKALNVFCESPIQRMQYSEFYFEYVPKQSGPFHLGKFLPAACLTNAKTIK